MFVCDSNPEPVAVTRTVMTRLDLFHIRWDTITTLSDAESITSIKIVHLDCLLTRTTEVMVKMIILRDGDAKAFPILDGVLPLGDRVNLLLPFSRKPAEPSAEETNERSANPPASSPFGIDWRAIPGLIGAKLKRTFRTNGKSAS